MKRRQFISLALAALVSAAPAFADDLTDSIVSQLTRQGFHDIRINRTFLGRIRIVAESDTLRRETVINPRTGEILRDLLTALDGSKSSKVVLGDPDDEYEYEDEGDDGESEREDGEDTEDGEDDYGEYESESESESEGGEHD